MCKRHLFLTGEIQVGKSTVVQAALRQLDAVVGGFYTGSGLERYQRERPLYLWDAADGPKYDETHCVALLGSGRQVFSDRFDALGSEALRRARERAQLIVMDECGYLERDAAQFQAQVLKTLDGDTPVFGVVRQQSGLWTQAIFDHPQAELVTVTRENRDELPDRLAQALKMRLEGCGALQTQRLTLRNFRPADADTLFDYRNDERCSRYQRYEDTGREALQKFVRDYAKSAFLSVQAEQHYAIERRGDGRMMGDLSVFFTEKDNCFTLGITLAPAFQGQGYAGELLREVTARLREKYPAVDLVALVERENEKSLALVRKLGFVEECYAESVQSYVFVIYGSNE